MRAFFLFLVLLNLIYFAVGDYLVPTRPGESSNGTSSNSKIPAGLTALHIITSTSRSVASPQAETKAGHAPKAQPTPSPAIASKPAAAATSTVVPKATVPRPQLCYSLGPFAARSAAASMLARFEHQGAKASLRKIQQKQVTAYWIYLPPFPSVSAAAAETRKLAAKGYHHYYIEVAAPHTNAISLGLFRERSGADRRLARLRRLGFNPRLQVRTAVKNFYWLDYREPTNGAISSTLWAHSSGGDGALQRVHRNCKTG